MPTKPKHSQEPTAPKSKNAPRKKRADAGVPHGPMKPHAPSKTHILDNGTAQLSLSGRHGSGKHLLVNTDDIPDLMRFTDNGTRLHVVCDGRGKPYVRIKGPKSQAWARSTNPDHLITAARFLVGETNGSRKIKFKDHNPFNLTRDNLEVEVPAKDEVFPINWEKAVAARQTKMASLPALHSEALS